MTNQDKKTQVVRSDPWTEKFNELNFKLFFNNPDGQLWLQMVEHRFFYAPVCIPGRDRSFADHFEGRNEFIRSIRNGAQIFMQKPPDPENKADPLNVNRERK